MIDGVRYAPLGERGVPRIGVAIKTRNRPEVLAKTLPVWQRMLPPDALLVVVDDASDKPVAGATFRFQQNVGIARASNKALELLYNAGCEHIFLADDDCYPLTEQWWRPYVESREPHLMAIFDKPKGASKRQVEVLYEDDEIVAYHATRGYLLYVERRVLDAVGGMDPAFRKWGWEHQSWSDRIHSAGFTTARYMDVPNSSELIYSMDQSGEVTSTATSEDRRFSEGPGLELRMESRHSPRYIEFRDLSDAVVTCLLTAQPDPQRNRPMAADPKLLEEWRGSLPKGAEPVVLHTDLPDIDGVQMVKVKQNVNVYFERWIGFYRYLRDHPEIGRVWLTDGTDVVNLRDPFPEMEEGVLYVGSEAKTLRDEWMLGHHPDKTLQDFMRANLNLPLLNAGLIGGPRDLVMRFCHAMSKMWFDDHIDWIYGWETKRLNDQVAGDMGAFNYVARTQFADVIEYGPHVNTVFKLEEKNNTTAWWKHR